MQVNYPELGGTDSLKCTYKEGDFYTHPSGAIYKVIDGDFRLVMYPDGNPGPYAHK